MRRPLALLIALVSAVSFVAMAGSATALRNPNPNPSTGGGTTGGGTTGGGTTGGGGTSSSNATASFFGTSVNSGTKLSTVNVDGGTPITLKSVTVSSVTSSGCSTSSGPQSGALTSSGPAKCSTSVSASGTVYVGSESTGLAASISYTDSNNWTFTIGTNAAGTGYTQPSGSSLDFNTIAGTISKQYGQLATKLTATGASFSAVSGTAPVSIVSGKLVAALGISDLTLPTGGTAGQLQALLSSSGAAQAVLAFAKSSATVPVTLSYTDRNNWTATVTKGTAGSGASASLTGTVSKSSGTLSSSLQFQGVTIGNATVDATATITASGITATVTLTNVVLSGEFQSTIDSFTWSTDKYGARTLKETETTSLSEGGVSLVTGTATMSTDSPATSISATFSMGDSTLSGSASYTDADDWSVSIAANSAGAGYAPANATSFNLNNLSGSIVTSGGIQTDSFTLSGVTVGNATFNAQATYDDDGFTASAQVSDMEIGGFTVNDASITLSTETSYAEISGDISTDAGDFSADIQATALSGGGYTLAVSVSGADLEGGTSEFRISQFSFSWTKTVSSSGCTQLKVGKSTDVSVSGTLVMGNTTYDLEDVTLDFQCEQMTKFEFDISVSHTPDWSNQTKTVTLKIQWDGTPGSYTPTFGPNNMFSGDTYDYSSGYFGVVDLSDSRGFSKKYDDRTFSETITIGLGFSVAVYTPTNGGATTADVGAFGYFDADRVSGDITCDFEVTPGQDFDCGGTMRVNPSWAGVYREDWSGF